MNEPPRMMTSSHTTMLTLALISARALAADGGSATTSSADVKPQRCFAVWPNADGGVSAFFGVDSDSQPIPQTVTVLTSLHSTGLIGKLARTFTRVPCDTDKSYGHRYGDYGVRGLRTPGEFPLLAIPGTVSVSHVQDLRLPLAPDALKAARLRSEGGLYKLLHDLAARSNKPLPEQMPSTCVIQRFDHLTRLGCQEDHGNISERFFDLDAGTDSVDSTLRRWLAVFEIDKHPVLVSDYCVDGSGCDIGVEAGDGTAIYSCRDDYVECAPPVIDEASSDSPTP